MNFFFIAITKSNFIFTGSNWTLLLRLLEFKQNNTLNREQMRDFEHFIMGSLNKIKTDSE